MEALPGAVQMITGDGTYRAADVEGFIGSCKELSAPRTPCTVVSIIGPQSSGKSYLLNCLFGTNFGVMDGAKGRRQTTKGIWLAKCIHPSFLVMDVEGSDGRERGEDDTSFEKQSALFALVVSDLILVNMWLHDIGRLQGGNIPLLKLIFKERTKLEPHKTRMVLVIRDYDYETPEEILKKDVMATLKEIWRSVDCGNIRKLSDYISLSVMIFPPKREELRFEEKCAELREWLATGSLAGLRQNKVPAFGFSFSAESIWETVRQNERLNLPSHKILVAEKLCSRMKSKKLASLESDENFLALTGDTPACPKDFLIIMEKLVEQILNDFDAGTEGLDETVAGETRKELELQIQQLLKPACEIMLKKLNCAILDGSMNKISNALSDKDLKTEIVASLDTFDDQCQDLKLKYGTSVAEHRAALASGLDTFAREKAREIKKVVAYMLCSRMKSEKLASLESDENFLALKRDTSACPKDFLNRMEKLVEQILNDFDSRTEGLDETVASKTRNELALQILQLLKPACGSMLKKVRCAILNWSMEEISNALSDTDHPAQSVDTVIRRSLDIFDDKCRDLKLKYGTSVAEHRAALASRLYTSAREEARKIKSKRDNTAVGIRVVAAVVTAALPALSAFVQQ